VDQEAGVCKGPCATMGLVNVALGFDGGGGVRSESSDGKALVAAFKGTKVDEGVREGEDGVEALVLKLVGAGG
jgi:hypothetical protein